MIKQKSSDKYKKVNNLLLDSDPNSTLRYNPMVNRLGENYVVFEVETDICNYLQVLDSTIFSSNDLVS